MLTNGAHSILPDYYKPPAFRTEATEEERQRFQTIFDQCKANPNDDNLVLLGSSYLKGIGVPKSPQLAFASNLAAHRVNRTNPTPLYNLAWSYANGVGVDKNDEEAYRYFLICIEMDPNYALGLNRLGLCYLHGHGIDQNHQKAYQYFKRAALAANVNAEKSFYQPWQNLGDCLANGTGTNIDRLLASACYKKALSIDMRAKDVWTNLAKLYLAIGNPELSVICTENITHCNNGTIHWHKFFTLDKHVKEILASFTASATNPQPSHSQLAAPTGIRQPAAENANDTAQQKIAELNQQITALNRQVHEKDQQLRSHLATANERKTQIDIQNNSNTRMEAELAASVNQLQQTKAVLDAHIAQLTTLQNIVDQQKQEMAEKDEKIFSHESVITEKDQKIAALEAEIAKKEDEIQAFEDDKAEDQAVIAYQKQIIEHQTHQIQQLKQHGIELGVLHDHEQEQPAHQGQPVYLQPSSQDHRLADSFLNFEQDDNDNDDEAPESNQELGQNPAEGVTVTMTAAVVADSALENPAPAPTHETAPAAPLPTVVTQPLGSTVETTQEMLDRAWRSGRKRATRNGHSCSRLSLEEISSRMVDDQHGGKRCYTQPEVDAYFLGFDNKECPKIGSATVQPKKDINPNPSNTTGISAEKLIRAYESGKRGKSKGVKERSIEQIIAWYTDQGKTYSVEEATEYLKGYQNKPRTGSATAVPAPAPAVEDSKTYLPMHGAKKMTTTPQNPQKRVTFQLSELVVEKRKAAPTKFY